MLTGPLRRLQRHQGAGRDPESIPGVFSSIPGFGGGGRGLGGTADRKQTHIKPSKQPKQI